MKSRFLVPEVPSAILRLCLRELPPAQRDSIVYTHFIGFTHAEAGKILVTSRPAVTQNIRRGIKNLRKAVKKYGY
jgi:DNA-directed RNA polymerase specialized sigma24 family protein